MEQRARGAGYRPRSTGHPRGRRHQRGVLPDSAHAQFGECDHVRSYRDYSSTNRRALAGLLCGVLNRQRPPLPWCLVPIRDGTREQAHPWLADRRAVVPTVFLHLFSETADFCVRPARARRGTRWPFPGALWHPSCTSRKVRGPRPCCLPSRCLSEKN